LSSIRATPIPPLDARALSYERSASAISEGQRLYNWMNCSGCHFHGGGGMGVALMDDKWRYGGRIDQIVASIAEGRPNGMPAWRGKLTEQQMWQIAAYVRSLSGQVPKDSVSARADETSNTPPQTQVKREPTTPADSAEQ
jgi:cytochrome c oxidase cbb3-type subunit 3